MGGNGGDVEGLAQVLLLIKINVEVILYCLDERYMTGYSPYQAPGGFGTPDFLKVSVVVLHIPHSFPSSLPSTQLHSTQSHSVLNFYHDLLLHFCTLDWR